MEDKNSKPEIVAKPSAPAPQKSVKEEDDDGVDLFLVQILRERMLKLQKLETNDLQRTQRRNQRNQL